LEKESNANVANKSKCFSGNSVNIDCDREKEKLRKKKLKIESIMLRERRVIEMLF